MARVFLWVIEFCFMETYGEVEALTRKILTSATLVLVARWAPQRCGPFGKEKERCLRAWPLEQKSSLISLSDGTGFLVFSPCIVV